MNRHGDPAPTRPEGTIAVMLTLFADLRRFLPRGAEGPQRLTLAEGATVADLLATIGIAPDVDLTAAVDGELADRDTRLRDGADVMLLAPMEGGSPAAALGSYRRKTPRRRRARSSMRGWTARIP